MTVLQDAQVYVAASQLGFTKAQEGFPMEKVDSPSQGSNSGCLQGSKTRDTKCKLYFVYFSLLRNISEEN